MGTAAYEALQVQLQSDPGHDLRALREPRVAAEVTLPPAAHEALSLFDLPDQDDDYVDEENED